MCTAAASARRAGPHRPNKPRSTSDQPSPSHAVSPLLLLPLLLLTLTGPAVAQVGNTTSNSRTPGEIAAANQAVDDASVFATAAPDTTAPEGAPGSGDAGITGDPQKVVDGSEDANRLGFADRDTLPPNGGYAVYNFDTKEPGLGVPDVLLTVKSSPSNVAVYCNPAWVTAREGQNKIAGPLNSIFQYEGEQSKGSIYLAADNPVSRPPEARYSGFPAYEAFVPSYNCTVINYDTDKPAHYTLSATFNFHDVVLNAEEQNALRIIWNEVCRGRVRESEAIIKEQGTGGILEGELANLTCAQWVNVNQLNGKVPFTDFCNVVGNACNREGRLTQLNLNGWNLEGDFPMEELENFKSLTELDLSNNPKMAGDLKNLFDGLAVLKSVQVVELTGNAGMSGTFGYAATEENDRRSSLCVTAESGLRILNMANLGLFDLQIPSCLMGAQSTLEEIRLANNGIVGTVPDVFDATSPLQFLSLRGNELEGTIPSTLGLAPDLATFDISGNGFTGAIPRNLGHPSNLRFLHMGFNQLSGSIPSTLALHPTLESLDVRNNQLTVIPQEWERTFSSTSLIAQASLVYLRLANNNFTSDFPETLAKLPKLVVLSMENNNFKGDLPNIAGGFTALRFFDISNNDLSGYIPSDLSDMGVVRLTPTEAATINQYTGAVTTNQEAAAFKTVTFQQVFNVSGNRFIGTLPIWMYGDNMPPYAEAGIDISRNLLTIDCKKPLPEQLQYLTADRACPQNPSADALQGLAQITAQGEGIAAPEGEAPMVAPAAAPAVVEAEAEAPEPLPEGFSEAPLTTPEIVDVIKAASPDSAAIVQTDVQEGQTDETGGAGGASDGALPGYAKAVITIGSLLLAALVVMVVFLARRSRGHEKGFVDRFRPLRPSGFSKMEDAETGSGHVPLAFGSPPSHGKGGNVQMGGFGRSDPGSYHADDEARPYINGASNGGMHHRV